MSTVESQGFPKTGRRGISAALRAEGVSAARTKLVFSGSISKSPTSKKDGRQTFSRARELQRAELLAQLGENRALPRNRARLPFRPHFTAARVVASKRDVGVPRYQIGRAHV